MLDTQDNKILGLLANKSITLVAEGENFAIANWGWAQDFERGLIDLNVDVVVTKNDGKYSFSDNKTEYMNINYDLLDKIMENNLCCRAEELNKQNKELCSELDRVTIAVTGRHHECMLELAKADSAVDVATYSIDTYM